MYLMQPAFKSYSVCVFQDLVKVHKSLLQEIQDSVQHRSAQNLHQIFIAFKERYHMYFSNRNPLKVD